MKKQRGQALILVLILLVVGALLIVPALRFTFTGLKSQGISEDALTTQAAADAAVEDALWQMLNGVLGTLNPDNPEYTYDFEFEFGRFPVSIQIPSIPESEWTKFQQIWVKVDVEPNWLEAGAGVTTFTYVIRINMPQWDITNFGFTLPLGLAYDSASTLYQGPAKSQSLDGDAPVDYPQVWMNDQWVDMIAGGYEEVYDVWPPDPYDPNIAYLLITDGGQTLEWMPVFDATGRRVLIQAFQATGEPSWGVHYVEPWFESTSGGWINQTDPTGALGVAIYNIIIEVEGTTYQVVVAYDSTTGEFKIISYQIVG